MYHDFLPPIIIYPCVGFPYFSYHDSFTCGLHVFSNPHSFSSLCHFALATWRTHQGYVTHFRASNHLIESLDNPLLRLEALIHIEAHYGRACQHEVPQWFNEFESLLLDYSNALLYWREMGWIGSYARVLVDFHYILGLFIWGPIPLKGHMLLEWALRDMGLHHSQYDFMDTQQCSVIAHIPPFGWGWCTWSEMPDELHTCTIHLSIGLSPAIELGLM